MSNIKNVKYQKCQISKMSKIFSYFLTWDNIKKLKSAIRLCFII